MENILQNHPTGYYIWSSKLEANDIQSNVGFYKDFVLDNLPNKAEILLYTSSSLTLYVNNINVCYIENNHYIDKKPLNIYDIAAYLETGKNHIIIQASNQRHPHLSCSDQAAAIWAQLEINDKVLLASDKSWLSIKDKSITPNTPRKSPTSFNTRIYNFTKENNLFYLQQELENNRHVDFTTWNPSEEIAKVNNNEFDLDISQETFFSENFFNKKVILGKAELTNFHTNISFESIFSKSGNYMASCFFTMEEEIETQLIARCDDSYKLYLNGELIINNGTDINLNDGFFHISWDKPLSYAKNRHNNIEKTIKLNKGENQILILYYTQQYSAGISLSIPELSHNKVTLKNSNRSDSDDGWIIAGPLKIPFSQLSGTLSFSAMKLYKYDDYIPNNTSSLLDSFIFYPKDEQQELSSRIQLEEGEFVTLNANQLSYAKLAFSITTDETTIIDIIYNQTLPDNKPTPISLNRLCCDTLILHDKKDNLPWTSYHPCSFKYATIFIRKGSLTLSKPYFLKINSSIEQENYFKSDDDIINQIYQTSLNTLNASSLNFFASDPLHKRGQFIDDTYIHSNSNLLTTGNTALTKKAILDFAYNQYETGEIPALAPSSFATKQTEAGLWWLLLIHDYAVICGDLNLIKSILPNIKRSLAFYDNIIGQEGLLNPEVSSHCLHHFTSDDASGKTALNCLYYSTLNKMSWLFKVLDADELANRLNEKATILKEKILNFAWDEEEQLLCDNKLNEERSSYSLYTNMLGIASNVIPKNIDQKEFFKRFFTYNEPYINSEKIPFINCHLANLIMEAAFNLNEHQWATSFMKYYWKGALDENIGTFPKRLSNKYDQLPTKALCYGAAASPTVFLIKHLLGISPVSTTYKQIIFKPFFFTKSIDTSITTPLGELFVKWTKNDTKISIYIRSMFSIKIFFQVPKALQDIVDFDLGYNVSLHQE